MCSRAGTDGPSRCSLPAEPPYTGLARIYDDVVGDAVFPLIRRSFERALRRYNVAFSSAADIGCGTGRFLEYLQSFRIPVIGVDRSPQMLQMAAARCSSIDRRNLVRQELVRLRLPFIVDLITCNFDTLNYALTTQELQEIFKRISLNLAHRGHFFFDMLSPTTEEGEVRATVDRIRLPNVRGKWITYWNPKNRATAVHMVHWFNLGKAGSVRMEETHRQRWYPSKLIRSLVKRNGFRLRGAHEAQTFRPAAMDSHWVKWIAQKIS